MIIALIILFLFLITSVLFERKPSAEQAFSIPQTQAIKGFFVVTIFFSHFCSYVHFDAWYDSVMLEYCHFLGQLMVAPFLFYSGYGIFESVKKKGTCYVKGLPKKRILKVLLHFDFAVLLFLLLDLIIERPVSLSEFVLSLVAWESIGNSNWFIFAIMCAYAFAYIGLRLFKNELMPSLFFITALSLVYIVVVLHFKSGYWIDTILAFPLGCSLSLFKDKFNAIVCKKFVALGGGVGSVFVLFFAKSGNIPNSLVNSQIALFAFLSFIVFFSLYVHINSKVLTWFAAYVFEFYILQRIPMNFLAHWGVNEENIYLFFIVSFACTLLLSVLFSKWNKFFDSVFLNGSKR